MPKKGSYKADLVQGETYFWCTCGQSKAQPWCDGSHKGTDFKPLKFTWDQPDKPKASICGCKLNKDESGAICDRSHRFVGEPSELKDKPVGFQRTAEFRAMMIQELANDAKH